MLKAKKQSTDYADFADWIYKLQSTNFADAHRLKAQGKKAIRRLRLRVEERIKSISFCNFLTINLFSFKIEKIYIEGKLYFPWFSFINLRIQIEGIP